MRRLTIAALMLLAFAVGATYAEWVLKQDPRWTGTRSSLRRPR